MRNVPGFASRIPRHGGRRGASFAGIEVVELQEADAGAVRAHDHIAHPAAGVVEHAV